MNEATTTLTRAACHAREVIEQAFVRYGTPEIVNTDQGSQFTSTEFTNVVLPKGCRLSMDGRGAWRDNVFVERVWRSVKYERVYLKAYDSVSAARAVRITSVGITPIAHIPASMMLRLNRLTLNCYPSS